MTGDDDVSTALADAVAEERLRIVASLIRTTGDWVLAEDAVSDAVERALLTWPRDGVPDNPAAWLTTTARRRAIDLLRRARTEKAKLAEVIVDGPPPAPVHDVVDDRLRLVFTCCHPALGLEARVALTLKVVGGLSTEAIARAFLTSEPTMGQRLLRARKRIAHAAIPYRVPDAAMLPERLDGVLAVVYLVFTEGWAAAADTDLAAEAIRLGRLLVELVPRDEVAGLLALMLLQHSRRAARTSRGELVTLEHQDRTLWDHAEIADALTLLDAAVGPRGPYRLQAELAAVHARASHAGATDWLTAVALYDELLAVRPSPVVALNRAVAVGLAGRPQEGLEILDVLEADLPGHHLLAASRAHLLTLAGRPGAARRALGEAAALAPTEQERRQLLRRRRELAASPSIEDGA